MQDTIITKVSCHLRRTTSCIGVFNKFAQAVRLTFLDGFAMNGWCNHLLLQRSTMFWWKGWKQTFSELVCTVTCIWILWYVVPWVIKRFLVKKIETITTTLIYLLLLSFASFILCVGFLRKTSPLEVCERASHDFDHIIKKSACLNGFFLTTKYTGKSEESTSLFERAASSKIEQNSLLLVCSMFSETVFTNIQHTGWTWMDVFDLWAWLRYFKLCQHLKLDMKLLVRKRSLVFTGSVVFQVRWFGHYWDELWS